MNTDNAVVKPTIIPTIIKPNPQAEDQESELFLVFTREETEEHIGRLTAVTRAKEWTTAESVSVMVERHDGQVKMQFRAGSLVDYVLETRKGRKA